MIMRKERKNSIMLTLFITLLIVTSNYALDCYKCDSIKEEGCGEILSPLIKNITTCGGACLKVVINNKNGADIGVFRGCSEIVGETTCIVLTAAATAKGDDVQSCDLCEKNLCNKSDKLVVTVVASMVTALVVLLIR